MMHKLFKVIEIGEQFHVNGNDWVKHSTRTARMLSTGRVFYFSQNETVKTLENQSLFTNK